MKIILLYGLSIAEDVLYLLIPGAVGLLINTFLYGQGHGIVAFTGVYLGWQGIGVLRRIYDTKVYTHIYNQVCLQIIEHHKAEGIEISKINARIELLKQVVDFFENDIPYLVGSIVTMVGSAALLYVYNPQMMVVCLLILIPSMVINYFFGKKMVQITEKVNDEFEKQLEVIEKEDVPTITEYFQKVRGLNIKKSNTEAYNFGVLELFSFSMITVSIYVMCQTPNVSYGDIVATYGYILRFAYSFDFIPHLTERVATMHDIQERLEEVYA